VDAPPFIGAIFSSEKPCSSAPGLSSAKFLVIPSAVPCRVGAGSTCNGECGRGINGGLRGGIDSGSGGNASALETVLYTKSSPWSRAPTRCSKIKADCNIRGKWITKVKDEKY
jgi:hypothetical protein